jgi:signal transduction histidine kinase
LSIAAVAIVAVAFEPMRNRVQHAANRLVFGKRASPYEVLAQATRRLAEAGTPEETLAQVTHLVADGTGAVAAVLWLRVGDHLQPHSATPTEALGGLSPVALAGEEVPELPGEAVIPIFHRQELLGALTITKPRGQSVTGADEKVLADVAAGSGLLLRNIGLNAELEERAEQLRVSRRRLVAAQDAERHRLERDLHDGAQQQVVALKVKLGIARTLAEREGADKVVAIVTDLAATTQEAVDAMRAVAHGIYPPLLEAEGLAAALSAVRRTFPVPIDLKILGLGRYQRPVEESVYFCVVEVITRAVDSGASSIEVSLVGTVGSVEFRVRHDGQLDDFVAVEDRLQALEGRFFVTTEATAIVVAGVMTADLVLEFA